MLGRAEMLFGYALKVDWCQKHLMMIKMDRGPWSTAQDTLWRNLDLSERQFAKRETLYRTQVRQLKLSNAIQSGRIPSLGSKMYETIHHKKLEQRLLHLPIGK